MNIIDLNMPIGKDGEIEINKMDIKRLNNKYSGYNPSNFWFKYNDVDYLFKADFKTREIVFQDALKEIYVSNIASALNINCAEYYFAKNNENQGIITPSYLNNGEMSINIKTYLKKDTHDFSIFELYEQFQKKSVSNEQIFENINNLVQFQILNVMITQEDHQIGNVELYYPKTEKDNKSQIIKVAPKFDNSISFKPFDKHFDSNFEKNLDIDEVKKQFLKNYTNMPIFKKKQASVLELLDAFYKRAIYKTPEIFNDVLDKNIIMLDKIIDLNTEDIIKNMNKVCNKNKESLIELDKIFKIYQETMFDTKKKILKK